ncbi:MAG TPA: MaoC family dehydratase [Azospirillaceae bacterium]|nr:MaoC family dehydratase [Azospirillaceae bacterium]
MREFQSVEELKAAVGQELGTGPWTEIGQATVDAFAEATGDHQWIHVDVERSRRESPFGTTVAHGFLTLALFPQAMYDLWRLVPAKGSLNYGLNRVRFPAPVRTGSRVRIRAVLKSVDTQEGGRVLCTVDGTMEIEGGAKPACSAEMLVMFLV